MILNILLNSKKGQQQKAPKRGNKSTDQNSVESARQALFECIEYKAPISKTSSKGTLQSCSPFWTSITTNKGTHLHTIGFSHKGIITLYPEEAAFLVSRNALVVTDDKEKVLGFQDFCEILCDDDTDGWINFDKYEVYAYLKRLGYIVLRSKPVSDMPSVPITESNKDRSISLWKLFFDKISYWIYKDQNIPLVWNYKYSSYRKFCYNVIERKKKSNAEFML